MIDYNDTQLVSTIYYYLLLIQQDMIGIRWYPFRIDSPGRAHTPQEVMYGSS